MARSWKVKFTSDAGQVWTSYIHDDGKWEPDQAMPPLDYVEYAELVRRTNLAAAQFNRLGWQGGELEKES